MILNKSKNKKNIPAEPTARWHPMRDRRVVCWAMYDWANSAYTTLLITVSVAYIQRVVFPVDTWGTTGAVVWAWGISLSMFLGAVLSPLVGALADARGSKRQWLAVTALSGSMAAIAIGCLSPQRYVLIVVLFVTANLMLELSLGIYDGFLPEIVREDQVNAASAWGYGLGYLGGGLALVLAILLIQFGDSLGLETMTMRLQASLILMGLWWGVFTIPAIVVLRDQVPVGTGLGKQVPSEAVAGEASPRMPGGVPLRDAIGSSFADVWQTIRGLRHTPALALFLLSFLFYNDGVQTIISQASTFALQELSFAESELMAVILLIQFLAFPGALLVARVADWTSDKTALLSCLFVWAAVLVAALWIDTKPAFWGLAAVIAIVLGGTQAVSRSVMASMIPEGENAKYFGFFHLSGKATSFIGTFVFGAIVASTGSSRWAIFGLLPLFVIGAALLTKVSVRRRTP